MNEVNIVGHLYMCIENIRKCTLYEAQHDVREASESNTNTRNQVEQFISKPYRPNEASNHVAS